ncbi:DUF2384 domain-containing protein [Rhodovulum sp. DZ06]|uniref:DUF2384 domain-containing protein n=1 Tax=Rhodovulum sp. DZ06 TaxID=3425126 RepID=UPI003D34EAA6
MNSYSLEGSARDRQDVALKAFARIADAWSLAPHEAATLADMSEVIWEQARQSGCVGELSSDQMLRLSALIGLYTSLELYFDRPTSRDWVRMPNGGPELGGASPIDAMIAGGLSRILRMRGYVDALREGV